MVRFGKGLGGRTRETNINRVKGWYMKYLLKLEPVINLFTDQGLNELTSKNKAIGWQRWPLLLVKLVWEAVVDISGKVGLPILSQNEGRDPHPSMEHSGKP